MFTPVVGELSATMIFFPSSSRPAQLALSGVPVWSLYGAPWLQPVAAEAVGIDSFNIGEHYRTEFMDSASHVVLAAIASRTERIRLGTAVTVLSTQDPVRLYTDFATLDAVSNGRAQLIVGRGSLTDSFPLFGFDLADYEQLFEEKLDLLVRLLREQPVTWSVCRSG